MSETTPPKQKTFDEAFDAIGKAAAPAEGGTASGDGTTASAPPSTEPTSTQQDPTPAEKPKRAFKFDHEEQEVDETWLSDEQKWTKLKELAEKGYGLDRRLTRAEEEARQKAQRDYNAWFTSQGYEMVRDETHPSGWRLQQKQVAKPAQETADPLATEEADLRAKVKAAEVVDPEWLIRLTEIKAERAKLDALNTWRTQQEAAAQDVQRREAYEQAKRTLTAEAEKFIDARAKSFEGPDAERRRKRIAAIAVERGEAAARNGQSWNQIVEATKAVIAEEADDLDLRQRHYRESLPKTPEKPQSAPIVGTAPAGGATPNKPKNIDEALDGIAWTARR